MLIEWVNNASFIPESDSVRHTCDAWVEGTNQAVKKTRRALVAGA
jgi:hypothetical protein